MSRNFVLTPDAEADAVGIWERFADDDAESAADRVLARIYDECQKLGAMPGLGHYRENLLDQQYKFWNVWSYLIADRWQVTPIQIVAIVYGARDLNSFFGRRLRQ